MNARARNLGFALLVLCWPLSALADCVDTRRPTAAEMDFANRGIAALVAALPPVPVNARLSEKDLVQGLSPNSNLCIGKTGEFSLEVRRSYDQSGPIARVTIVMNVPRWIIAGSDLSASYGSPNPNRSAGLRVHNVMWTIGGPDTPLRKTLAEALDRERLEGLVGKPLPTVAQSQALAAQAVPATVPVAAAAAAARPAPATQSASQPASAPSSTSPPAAPDPTREAVDTVNRLRGLFGR